MTTALYTHIDKTNTKDKDSIVDVKLTVDDIELDIKEFVELWESQVDRMIDEAAKNLVNDKFSSLRENIDCINDKVSELISNNPNRKQ